MPSRNTVKTETLVEEVNDVEVEYSTVMRVALPFALTVPRMVAVSASTLVLESSETVGVPIGKMTAGKREASSFPLPLVPQFAPPQHQILLNWSMPQVVPMAALILEN